MKRPANIPKLKEYIPTKFMARTSHYDKEKADRAVSFIESLSHTTGEWNKKPFYLLPWQEQIIRDVFGIVKKDGTRQFREAYVEIPKKNGKSELAAAIALYMLFGDREDNAQVFGAASDKNQASLVFNVAKDMALQAETIKSICTVRETLKEIENNYRKGTYKVLSADVEAKHGLNISALIFDELHTQKNRKFFDVLTMGSGDARRQPLFFYITTAGDLEVGKEKENICYYLHCKSKDILNGKKKDPSFYPVLFGLDKDEDWHDPANWKRANPSLGYTISMEAFKIQYNKALETPGYEKSFRTLRLNTWSYEFSRWINIDKWDACKKNINLDELRGRPCYGGLDLSSTTDVTAFVLVFPPIEEDEPYIVLPYFWIPHDTILERVRRDGVPYDEWLDKGLVFATEGNVIHYGYIERFIDDLGKIYNIKEIAFDRWGAVQMTQNLEGMGFTVVPFGQGFASMSPPIKELMKLILGETIAHDGNEVLRWMIDNVYVKTDEAENIKFDKAKSTERIDGAVALVMALDRAIRNGNKDTESVYDDRGIIIL